MACCRAEQLAWLDELAADVTGPVLVFGHHPVWNLDAAHVDPHYAIARDDSLAFAQLVARRESIVGYFAGTRTRTGSSVSVARRAIPLVEVGCTKDYPGAWAEYRVYEGGYTQVVRRVTEPAASRGLSVPAR